MSFKLRDTLEPAFDGGLLQNKFVTAGMFIVKTKAQRNAQITPLYRELSGTTTTLCYIDGDQIYRLINNPASETTTDADWEPIGTGTLSTLTPLGDWNANNTDPVLQDVDAVNTPDGFYIVTGAPTVTDVTHPGLFEDQTVQVVDGWWVISKGTAWFVGKSSTSWEALDRPQVIIDYENGIVIAHTHEISEVNGLQTALDSKLDASNVTPNGSTITEVSNDLLPNVLFLKNNYYDKGNTYNKGEVDALLSQDLGSDFNGNRTIINLPELGEIPGGTKINDFTDNIYYSKQASIGEIVSIDPIEIGATTAPVVNGKIERRGADFIQSITIYDQDDQPQGSPTFTGTDPVIEFSFAVNTAIEGIESPSEGYYMKFEYSTDAVVTEVTTTQVSVITVYPILIGDGVAGLDDTGKYNILTKYVQEDGNLSLLVNSNSNRIYICVPEDYVDRVEIKDDTSSNLLGSFFPEPPVIEPVTSVGLTTNWTKNYKVYQSTYDSDTDNIELNIIIIPEVYDETTTLDGIPEGDVNKHLTVPLRDKLVNFSGADYLTKAQYDPNDQGFVSAAHQLKFYLENTTGSIVAKDTVISIEGLGGSGNPSFVIADKDIPQIGQAVTLEDIPAGGFGTAVLFGAIFDQDTSGQAIDDPVFLGSNGALQFDEPASGVRQVVGLVLKVDPTEGVILIRLEPEYAIRNTLSDWRPLFSYTVGQIVYIDAPEINGIFRCLINHISTNDFTDDWLVSGYWELTTGDMVDAIYNPRNIEGPNPLSRDVFDMDNMTDGVQETDPNVRKVVITEAQRSKLDSLEPASFKGTFPDPTALRAAHPESQDGDSADVISTTSTWAWDSGAPPTPPTIGGDWVDTGLAIGGDMQKSVYDPAGKSVVIWNVDNHEDGITNKVYPTVDKDKLASVEFGATADQSAAEIKVSYESNPDTNAFTNAEQTKLAGIEDFAKDDQSAAEVPYDNSTSGLAATDVQAAVDEIDATVDDITINYLDKATYDPNDDGIVTAAQQVMVLAKNDTGAAVPAGKVVFLSSADVTGSFFQLADRTNPNTLPVAGFTIVPTNNGEEAQIVSSGTFQIANFGGFSAGDALYLDTAGDVVTTIPPVSSGSTVVLVGVVTGIVAGDVIIEVLNVQTFASQFSSFDPTTSPLTQTNVQDALAELANTPSAGDMQKSVYDPTLVEGDAFAMDNMVEGATTKILTDVERTKLAGIEDGAQVNKALVMGNIHKTFTATALGAGSGELTQLTNQNFQSNTSQPSAGQIAVDVASYVNVTIAISGEHVGSGETSVFTLHINGAAQTNLAARTSSGSGQQGSPDGNQPTISWSGQLAADDYISVFHSGDAFSLWGAQITIHGQEI